MKYNNPMRTIVASDGPISITTKEFDDRIGNLVATMERVTVPKVTVPNKRAAQ